MDEPCIHVRNLTKSFAGRTVVDNLSLDVQKGEDGISIDMSYLPTACIIQGSGGRRVHQPIPCWEQEQRRGGLEPLSDSELKKTQRAFDHVTEICGLENAGLIEWTEEYDKQA